MWLLRDRGVNATGRVGELSPASKIFTGISVSPGAAAKMFAASVISSSGSIAGKRTWEGGRLVVSQYARGGTLLSVNGHIICHII
jgi:hypothetical protein